MQGLKDAIDHGRLDDVLRLLEVSPGLEIEYDVTSSFSVLLSPLHYAAKEGKLEVCKALYKECLIEERVSKVYCSILSQDLSAEEIENNKFVRSREGHVFSSDALQALFNYNKRNENPQTRSYMGNEVFEMPNKYTPLHYSVLGGHIGIVDLFLSTGNHEDQVYSALQLAACIGSSEAVINLLLDKCVEYPKANTYTPLVLSILYDEWKSLFCKEQWFEIESPEGKKALEYAVKFNQVELVEKILEVGGDVLTTSADRESVLDIALNKGSLAVLQPCVASLARQGPIFLEFSRKEKIYFRMKDAILEKNVDFIESIYALPWASSLSTEWGAKIAGDIKYPVPLACDQGDVPTFKAVLEIFNGSLDELEYVFEKGSLDIVIAYVKSLPSYCKMRIDNQQWNAIMARVKMALYLNQQPFLDAIKQVDFCMANDKPAFNIDRFLELKNTLPRENISLMEAIYDKNTERIAECMQEGKINIFEKNALEDLPFSCALLTQNIEVVQKILEGHTGVKGFTIDHNDKAMLSNMLRAAINKNEAFIKLVSAWNWGSPIFEEEHRFYISTVGLLVKNEAMHLLPYFLTCGASIEALGSSGTSPLVWAVREGKFEAISILIDEGADTNSVRNNFLLKEVLALAAECGKWELCTKLLNLENITWKEKQINGLIVKAKWAKQFNLIALICSKYLDLSNTFSYLTKEERARVIESSNFNALLSQGPAVAYSLNSYLFNDEKYLIIDRLEPTWSNILSLFYNEFWISAVQMIWMKMVGYLSTFGEGLKPISSKSMKPGAPSINPNRSDLSLEVSPEGDLTP